VRKNAKKYVFSKAVTLFEYVSAIIRLDS